MPRFVEAEIGNFAPRQLTFAMPDGVRTAPTVYRLQDGSLILDAVPLIADQDLLYYGYELPLDQLFGEGHGLDWDSELTGRLTMECAENCADQFEGLAITDGHITVEAGHRDEVAVGTFLRDATIEGTKVKARALLYAAPAIVKVDANGSELSIGGMALMSPNPNRFTEGEPDFFINRINLNHVALVEYGRAGPDARLLNHRASLAHKQEEVKTMKITINGVEVEVPDVAVNHYAGLISTLENERTTLTAANTALTTERDTAQGALVAAQSELANANTQIETLTAAQPDVTQAAAALANEHSAFVTEAQRLGHTEDLALGAYDRAAVMRTVLNARGAAFADDASVDMLTGAWQFAVANAGKTATSVLDHNQPSLPALPVASTAAAAVTNSYFGGVKKKDQ